jgi:hypothetical protein
VKANGLAGAARRIFQKRLEKAYSRKSSGLRIHLGVIVVALIGSLSTNWLAFEKSLGLPF